MRRIDLVYQKLLELYEGQGLTTTEIAQALQLSRANISSDLNDLCRKGLCYKEAKKPVIYHPINPNDTAAVVSQGAESKIDAFAKKNASLLNSIRQAKAAILYPPHGMHIMILGETGVGKSMFASIVYEYAIEKKIFIKDAPFIVFNCSDYANNPQLLLGHIFGVKKGAYTGADTDMAGLIERADNGVLFLDEIHRMPPEGQEMLFTFIDKSVYRRLGESGAERYAKVLIIAATTEDIQSSLLKTFTRRIPMSITLPNLKERTVDERLDLVCSFLQAESARLHREITVSINAMKAFLSYDCHGNIGQLKNDIQLSCAKVYLDYISETKESMHISSLDLSEHIKEGLYQSIEYRKLWQKLDNINTQRLVFTGSNYNPFFKDTQLMNDEQDSIYTLIDTKLNELKNKGVQGEIIETSMDNYINEYFKSYIYSVKDNVDINNLNSIIEHKVIDLIEKLISVAAEKLNRKLSTKIYYAFAIHIDSCIKRIGHGNKVANPHLSSIRMKHKEEFNVALLCLETIENEMDIVMPLDEAGFITMFFVYDEEISNKANDLVQVIVIAHGDATATSMADTANKLLGVDHAIGVNAFLNQTPKNVMIKTRALLQEKNIIGNVLFLVDMGSLANIGKELEKELSIKTKTISLVSTLHVMEAVRKAVYGNTLEQVYEDTMNVSILFNKEFMDTYLSSQAAAVNHVKDKKTLAIITICSSGEGGALAIKNYIEANLNRSDVEIINKGSYLSYDIHKFIADTNKDYSIVCIVTALEIKTKIPVFDLNEVLNSSGLHKIRDLIDIQNTYTKMSETLQDQLKHIDAREVIKDIILLNQNIQRELKIHIDKNVIIGVGFHLACTINRLVGGESLSDLSYEREFIKENEIYFSVFKRQILELELKYCIGISDEEIYYLINCFIEN